ncbi:MAG: phage baseplate assembly protein V [Candidatus Thiodiazotropha taylori]|uniref:Phage baseplate assembly protein V n=1 Tax=Candidatus Thiodiazotropha taylori TaxID=2792791 RepID=A0A9E4KA45_9GAMM|nr:phage baseplate assembly protein V [Candidatus Thiodiazotropha taylori]MCW4254990.1 phage baseplate assembly protein V [Candidatus Thiodiazotropha taylori]
MFYQGIVEDRNDPLEIGRVRVRVIGLHTPDKVMMPTETLPWATVMQPTTSAAASGVGVTPKLPVGSFVIVYFLDGENFQTPMIMGTIAGIQDTFGLQVNGTMINRQDPTKGFNTYPSDEYKGQSDLPKSARSGSVDKPRAKIALENDLFAFEEPDDLRAFRRYPHNQVRQSEAGHVEEWDDTPGNERIAVQHRTGTFEEIRPDGSKVTKVIGENFNLMYDDNNVYIDGACNIHVHNDSNLFVEGDYNVTVGGNYNLNVKGDYVQNIGENKTTQVGASATLTASTELTLDSGSLTEITAGEGTTINSSTNFELNVGGTTTVSSTGEIITNTSSNTTINSAGNFKTNTTGTNLLESTGIGYLRGSNVHLNDTAADVSEVELNLEFQDFDTPPFEYIEPSIIGIDPDLSLRSSQQGVKSSFESGSTYVPQPYTGLDPNGSYSVGNSNMPNLDWDRTIDPANASNKSGMQGLLAFIGAGEGGYNSSNNGTSNGRIIGSTMVKRIGGKLLTELTIGEIVAYQKGKRETGRQLFAVGRYQIIPTTMRSIVPQSGLTPSDLFNEENQDRLGVTLIIGNGKSRAKRPILASYVLGNSEDINAAMLDMAKEWASIPSPFTGKSYYGSGNNSQHTVDEVKTALISARREIEGDNVDIEALKGIPV